MNKNFKRILALILSVIMVCVLAGCDLNPDTIVDDLKDKAQQGINDAIQSGADALKDKIDDAINGTNDSTTKIENAQISITMLDVGQGLSVLVESQGNYLLYDGGDRGTSSYVVSYLKQHGVAHLDYMIASHYDSDHIAGLVGVLETASVSCVINPSYKATSKIYQSYVEKVDANGAEVIYPSVGDQFILGESTFTILAPAKDYGDANENSIAIKITSGDFSCIITGDAESKSEADMVNSGLDLKADLYIVGHHGSSSSTSAEFLNAVSPEYAFISCGKDNDYGHPHDETIAALNNKNIKYYRSDIDGEVTCQSDGKEFAFSK